MIKRGYDKSLALGTAAMRHARHSHSAKRAHDHLRRAHRNLIGDLFIAGILPGIMMAFLFSATDPESDLRPSCATLKESTPWPVKFRALGASRRCSCSRRWSGLDPLGHRHPTEAGAVGVPARS
jgi:hypothetical protein